MFNSGGVETETGEFLYGFVRMTKPSRILETGTHKGISSMYMAKALEENKKGHLLTLELFQENINEAAALWAEMDVQGRITCLKQSSLEYKLEGQVDLLFLDSEPQHRFDEFVNFYPRLKPGGFIFIHDLHPNLGRDAAQGHWADFREKIGVWMKDHSLQTFTFRTPRGFTVFQKAAPDFSHTAHLRLAS